MYILIAQVSTQAAAVGPNPQGSRGLLRRAALGHPGRRCADWLQNVDDARPQKNGDTLYLGLCQMDVLGGRYTCLVLIMLRGARHVVKTIFAKLQYVQISKTSGLRRF